MVSRDVDDGRSDRDAEDERSRPRYSYMSNRAQPKVSSLKRLKRRGWTCFDLVCKIKVGWHFRSAPAQPRFAPLFWRAGWSVIRWGAYRPAEWARVPPNQSQGK